MIIEIISSGVELLILGNTPGEMSKKIFQDSQLLSFLFY
jgi:hypothetical protein